MNKILDNIQSPLDLKKLSRRELSQLASEIRALIIETVSKNGGHLSSNLGAVELTLALHTVFDTPKDNHHRPQRSIFHSSAISGPVWISFDGRKRI
jgi:deoxyxylulose-5-phosphate synthase